MKEIITHQNIYNHNDYTKYIIMLFLIMFLFYILMII